MSQQSLIDFLQPAQDSADHRVHDFCVQIENILHSYDYQFDAFSELLQNSVDAILERWESEEGKFAPRIDVSIDYRTNRLTVLDNGCGVRPTDIEFVLRPNCSLKRRLGQKTARGEKGAAVVFLQFGHRRFEFQSKHPEGQSNYLLNDGQNWFSKVSESVQSDTSSATDVPESEYSIGDNVDSALEALDRGSLASIEFAEGSNLTKLSDVFSADEDVALTRLEYVLRTRTALGFVYTSSDKSDMPKAIQELTINIEVCLDDGSNKTRKIEPGFLYPHEIAKMRGSLASMMTNAKSKSELFYDFITKEFIGKYLEGIASKYAAIIEKYKVDGYVSYAYNNRYYEDLSSKHLGLDQTEHEQLADDMIQINGGFQVAVKEYPNGRRQAFLQRSGAEDKSRTYLVLNFNGPYKPDYGRKNLSHDVRAFVNDFCKSLMAFATQKDRKEKLKTGRDDSSHGISNVREARKVLEEDAKRLNKLGKWIDSDTPDFCRPPATEDEVVNEFLSHIHSEKLPGFKLYGIPSRLHLDALFDYSLSRQDEVIYNEQKNPLGVLFPEQSDEIVETAKWLEFKISSDGLVDNLKRKEGDPSKKYFILIDLLVCYSVDDATEEFQIQEVSDLEDVQDRQFFGVTHLMKSVKDQSHVIPVICLETLRGRWGR